MENADILLRRETHTHHFAWNRIRDSFQINSLNEKEKPLLIMITNRRDRPNKMWVCFAPRVAEWCKSDHHAKTLKMFQPQPQKKNTLRRIIAPHCRIFHFPTEFSKHRLELRKYCHARHLFSKAWHQHPQTVIQPSMWFMGEPSQFSVGQTAQSLTCSIMEKQQCCVTVWICYSHALEKGCLITGPP